jgi:hypothetical protein
MQRTPPYERTSAFAPGLPAAGGSGRAGRWARFLAGLLVILLFAFGVIPAVQRLGPVAEVREAIRSAGIDASALIYTESDVSFEAEASLRDALRFPPRDDRGVGISSDEGG